MNASDCIETGGTCGRPCGAAPLPSVGFCTLPLRPFFICRFLWKSVKNLSMLFSPIYLPFDKFSLLNPLVSMWLSTFIAEMDMPKLDGTVPSILIPNGGKTFELWNTGRSALAAFELLTNCLARSVVKSPCWLCLLMSSFCLNNNSFCRCLRSRSSSASIEWFNGCSFINGIFLLSNNPKSMLDFSCILRCSNWWPPPRFSISWCLFSSIMLLSVSMSRPSWSSNKLCSLLSNRSWFSRRLCLSSVSNSISSLSLRHIELLLNACSWNMSSISSFTICLLPLDLSTTSLFVLSFSVIPLFLCSLLPLLVCCCCWLCLSDFTFLLLEPFFSLPDCPDLLFLLLALLSEFVCWFSLLLLFCFDFELLVWLFWWFPEVCGDGVDPKKH